MLNNKSYLPIKKNNLYYFVLYGMIYEIIFRLYNPYQVKFLERIGGSDLDISLFNSLPGLIMVFTTLPAILIMKNVNSLRITGKMIIFQRLFILLYAVVPLLPSQLQPLTFILLTAIMSIPNSLYTNGFQSLTAELFLPEERALAISLKNRYGVIIITVITYVTGQILTVIPRSDAERIFYYQLFFITAFILTVFEYICLTRFKPLQPSVNTNDPFKDILRQIFKNKNFLLFMSCSLIFHFGWQMGWPLFSIYTIKNLGADENWLAIISIASMLTMFVGYFFWHNLIERFGNSIIVAVCTLGMSVTPILYIVSKDLYTLTFMASLTGIFTSGTLTVLLNSLFEVIPKKNRIFYMGVYTTFTNITLSIAPIIGHYFSVAHSIQFALFMTTLFRLIGGISFIFRNRWIRLHNQSTPEI
jgi:hypothetical protein